MEGIIQTIKSQSQMMLASNTLNNNGTFYTMTLSIILSTILGSIITGLLPCITRIAKSFHEYDLQSILVMLRLKKKTYEVMLKSREFNLFNGVQRTEISDEKMAVLNHVRKHSQKYKKLYKVKLSNKTTSFYDYEKNQDIEYKDSIYEIDQYEPIEIFREKDYYINMNCINVTERPNSDSEKGSRDTLNCDINKMYLISNHSLKYIYDFVSMCVKEYEKDKENDKNRYLYTFVGFDKGKERIPIYEEDIFIPYASFDGLVGNHVKEVEKEFDFFQSKKGELWYKKRNLPYHKTHCYYGDPGTGKSILACAIANKYNLHIVRIRLSSIKTNEDFIRIIRNENFNGKKIPYKDILYLFDEFDTEIEKIDKQNKMSEKECLPKIDSKKIQGPKKENEVIIEKIKSSLITNTSTLSFGVMLEELNGINQMYGRKMIIITNHIEKLKNIHKGAFVRPGRIDLMLELKKLSIDDFSKLMNMFYPNTRITRRMMSTVEDFKYTPAFVTNICKISKTAEDFFVNLDKYDI